MRHWLVVSRPDPGYDDVDLDVIHVGCPSRVTIYTSGEQDTLGVGASLDGRNLEYTEYLCDVQVEVDNGALGDIDVDSLPDGRHEIETWFWRYPAVPGLHGEEWDGGLRLVEQPAEPAPSVDLCPPPEPAPDGPHWVIVPADPDEDPVVEHDRSCASQVTIYLPGEDFTQGTRPVAETEYLCGVGSWLTTEGILDVLDVRDLPPGRYEIEAWFEHYPSTPDSAEEWDGGIRIVDQPATEEAPA